MESFPQPPRSIPETRGIVVPYRSSTPATPRYSEPQPPYDPATDEADHGGLLEYWRILRRHKGILILIAFLGAVAGFLFTLPQTPVYQAYTSVEIVPINENFLNIKEVNPISQTGTMFDYTHIQTQIRILQSQSLIDRVTAKLKTGKPLPTETSRVSAWRKALNLPAPAPQDTERIAPASLKVRSVGQTRLVEITVDSTEPEVAAMFANTLTSEYIEQGLEARWQATEKTGEWLTRQLDDMRIKLERSEDRLQEYARKAGLIFTQEKTNISEDKLRQIQTSLSASQTDRITKQSRYEMANSSPADALPDVLNDSGLRDYQTKLTDLRSQLAELTSTYTAEHPKVKRVQAQVATLDSALQIERAAILRRIKNEYEEAVRKEKLLSAGYDTQAVQVTGEGEKSIQYNILKREVDSNRQLYDTMLQQLKQATIASALRASNIRVVDPARVPGSPYKPNPRQNAGIGSLAGLFLGIALVIIRDRADRSIQQPGDCAYYLNVPELGIIPSAVIDFRKRLRLTTAASDAAPDQERVELITWQQKPSMVAEAFRSTLVSILFTGETESRPHVIVLTSAGPGEGKSTITSNLAIAISEVGQRVLLIDADMRKPRMHSIFGVDNGHGLSDLLRQREGPPDFAQMIQPSGVPGLSILPSGSSTATAASLLYGPQMAALLAILRQQYDTILVDTPPMLQIPDARVLGRQADRVILVVRAGKTTRDAAQAAFLRFREDGIRVLGTILNDWNPKAAPSGYYGYYGGYYKGYKSYYGSNGADSN